jgi:hypothetical protein
MLAELDFILFKYDIHWQTGLHFILLTSLIVSLLVTQSKIILFCLHLFTLQLLAETCPAHK